MRAAKSLSPPQGAERNLKPGIAALDLPSPIRHNLNRKLSEPLGDIPAFSISGQRLYRHLVEKENLR
jgi:hypothetical protein